MPLIAVVIFMTSIFSFSVGKMVYDPTVKATPTVAVSQLNTVYDVASKSIPLDEVTR